MPNEVLLLVTEEDWTRNKEAEPETATHPCTNWSPIECMCKGACSCHWVKMLDEFAATIITLKKLNSKFYWLCFNAGVGSKAHAFIEFNGLMTSYVEILEAAARAGIDPHLINEHSGVPLPVTEGQMRYLAEKLRCLFGPVIDSNKEARAILLKELFYPE